MDGKTKYYSLEGDKILEGEFCKNLFKMGMMNDDDDDETIKLHL